MRVYYTSRAVDDLVAIADYLKVRNSAAARAVETRIRNTISMLCEFPASGRSLEQRPQVHVMPVIRYPYLVFYMVAGDELRVLHIRHGSRRPIMPEEI